jgi:hypothetical protein
MDANQPICFSDDCYYEIGNWPIGFGWLGIKVPKK